MRGAALGWTIEFISDLHIVALVLSGELTGEELQESAAARIALGEEQGVTDFIIDARDLVAPRATTMAVYDIPARLYSEQNMPREARIAVVKPVDPGSAWIVQFYEDLCVNRGWRVFMASDRAGALAWLRPD